MWSGWGDMVAPSLVCLPCAYRDKTSANSCQMVLAWVQTFPGHSRVHLAPLCPLGRLVLKRGSRWTGGIFAQWLIFDLGKIWISPLCSTFGDLLRTFLKTFWGYFLTINCRLLSILQLLYLAQAMIIRFTWPFDPSFKEGSYGPRGVCFRVLGNSPLRCAWQARAWYPRWVALA